MENGVLGLAMGNAQLLAEEGCRPAQEDAQTLDLSTGAQNASGSTWKIRNATPMLVQVRIQGFIL